jgi:hypothetical protein
MNSDRFEVISESAPTHVPPLTPALSPEYKGEGVSLWQFFE